VGKLIKALVAAAIALPGSSLFASSSDALTLFQSSYGSNVDYYFSNMDGSHGSFIIGENYDLFIVFSSGTIDTTYFQRENEYLFIGPDVGQRDGYGSISSCSYEAISGSNPACETLGSPQTLVKMKVQGNKVRIVSYFASYVGQEGPPGSYMRGPYDWKTSFRASVTGSDDPDLGYEVYVGRVGETAGMIPEPSAWLLMLAGFGMVGAVARRRSARTVLAP